MRSIKETALALDRACAAGGVPYALMGGFAIMAWGLPRATMDVDALARLEAKALDRFLEACRKEGLRFQRDDARDALRGESHLTILDLESPYHVDMKIARTPEEHRQVAGAVEIRFEQGRLRVARAEDTVAYKLLFGSPQDLADARSVLVRQKGTIDWGALAEIYSHLRVGKKLESLLFELGMRDEGRRARK